MDGGFHAERWFSANFRESTVRRVAVNRPNTTIGRSAAARSHRPETGSRKGIQRGSAMIIDSREWGDVQQEESMKVVRS